MPDNSTQADNIVDAQKGKTGTGFEPAFVAQPWDRGLSVMDNEPTTGLADSGMPWSDNSWTRTVLHPDNGETLSAGPGTASTLGPWPIAGAEIHGRGAKYQNEKDLGPGASKCTPPGFDGMEY